MRTKDQVRRDVWKAMDKEGVSRFPGAEGRIPNFAGAKLAAEQLAGHRLWKRAQVIKVNPDSPQTHARRAALEEAGIVLPGFLKEAGDIPVDDVLDAAVAAWSAKRIAEGLAGCVPLEQSLDERGRKIAVWY